jgi:hypothetical protein
MTDSRHIGLVRLSAGRLEPMLPAVVAAGAATGLLLGLTLVMRGDEVPVFLVQPGVMVLAAGAAYLLDDTAREATDVVPRPLLRRRVGRVLPGLLVLALGWISVAQVLRWRSPSVPLDTLTWEAIGLSCLALAAAATVARRGEGEPGNMVASAGALLFLGLLIAQPLLHIRLLVTSVDDAARSGGWAALIVVALMTFVVASRDPAQRFHRPRDILRSGGTDARSV